MRNFIFAILMVAACGDGGTEAPKDAPKTIDSPTTTDGPVAATCASYCTAIMANCTGAVQQYATAADCTNTCMRYAAGTPGEMTMNTLACRAYHADAAASSPTVHCVHAGPGGGATCGATLCESFCSIATQVCPTQAPSSATCLASCGTYASTGTPYNQAIQSGNTAECRLYHLTAAATAPGTHCPHIATVSATCQ